MNLSSKIYPEDGMLKETESISLNPHILKENFMELKLESMIEFINNS